MVYNESQTLKDTWFVPVFFGIQLLVIAVGLLGGFIEGLDSTGYMVIAIVLAISMLIGLLIVRENTSGKK